MVEIILPAVVAVLVAITKVAHNKGYELPILSAILKWLSPPSVKPPVDPAPVDPTNPNEPDSKLFPNLRKWIVDIIHELLIPKAQAPVMKSETELKEEEVRKILQNLVPPEVLASVRPESK